MQFQTTKTCKTCGKPFRPRVGNQHHCEEHILRKVRKYPNCLYCGKKLLHGSPQKFCCSDCIVMFRIYGKSKAEVEKK